MGKWATQNLYAQPTAIGHLYILLIQFFIKLIYYTVGLCCAFSSPSCSLLSKSIVFVIWMIFVFFLCLKKHKEVFSVCFLKMSNIFFKQKHTPYFLQHAVPVTLHILLMFHVLFNSLHLLTLSILSYYRFPLACLLSDENSCDIVLAARNIPVNQIKLCNINNN